MSHIAAGLLLAATLTSVDLPPMITAADLARLTGPGWSGTLTYLDYGRGTPVSIPSRLDVTRSGTDSLAWYFAYAYPDEPRADGIDTVLVGKDGRTLDRVPIIERVVRDDGTLCVVTEKRGTDDGRPARLRYTYLIGGKSFSITKEVLFEDTVEWIQRNRYDWTR